MREILAKKWAPYLIIALLGFLLYLPTLFFGFTYLDDNVLILDNFRFLSNLGNIFEAFRLEVFHILHTSAAYYRPLLTISFILDAQLDGQAPFIYHLTNIVLHLAASCLLFLLLTKLGYRKILSLVAALFFLVHPVLTAAVAWIPGRNDSLLTVFALLSFIYFLKFLEVRSARYLLLTTFYFLLGLFTKETALFLIFIELFFLQFIVKEKLFSTTKILLAAGWFLVLLLWLPLRQAALVNPIPFTVADVFKSIYLNLPAVVPYIGKIILPFNLSVLPILQDTSPIYGIIAIVVVAASLIFSKNKRFNFLIFGAFWFLLFLLPAFIRPNPEVVADFIEHRVYLPLIGFIILILETQPIKDLNLNRKRDITTIVVLLFLLSLITFTYSFSFRDRLSFWTNAATNSPHSPLAHRNLGAMYYLDGQMDKAEPEYKKALALNPLEQMAHNNLGLIYMDRGNLSEAENEYKKELAVNPNYDNAHFNLGIVYAKEGKLKEAQDLWKKTIEINPDYVYAYQNLVILAYQQNNLSEAIFYLREMQKRNLPVNPELLKILPK